jgi:hypothetical protein
VKKLDNEPHLTGGVLRVLQSERKQQGSYTINANRIKELQLGYGVAVRTGYLYSYIGAALAIIAGIVALVR